MVICGELFGEWSKYYDLFKFPPFSMTGEFAELMLGFTTHFDRSLVV